MVYRVIIGLYGLVNILGGLMAFLSPNIKSVWSLVVGGVSGLLFLYFAKAAETKPGMAFRSAAALALLLALFWMYRINEVTTQHKSPVMAIGNLVLAIAVFATLGAGHMLAKKKSSPVQ